MSTCMHHHILSNEFRVAEFRIEKISNDATTLSTFDCTYHGWYTVSIKDNDEWVRIFNSTMSYDVAVVFIKESWDSIERIDINLSQNKYTKDLIDWTPLKGLSRTFMWKCNNGISECISKVNIISKGASLSRRLLRPVDGNCYRSRQSAVYSIMSRGKWCDFLGVRNPYDSALPAINAASMGHTNESDNSIIAESMAYEQSKSSNNQPCSESRYFIDGDFIYPIKPIPMVHQRAVIRDLFWPIDCHPMNLESMSKFVNNQA